MGFGRRSLQGVIPCARQGDGFGDVDFENPLAGGDGFGDVLFFNPSIRRLQHDEGH